MQDVVRFWLKKSANGFRVDVPNFLFEVENKADEPKSGRTADPMDYEYLNHTLTVDQPEVYEWVYRLREWLIEYSKETNSEELILMTEAYTSDENIVKYFQSPTDENRKGSHIPFNFHFITELDKYSNASDIKRIVDNRVALTPKDSTMNWVLGNHDQSRVASRWGTERIDIALVLGLTLPGVAIIYNVNIKNQFKLYSARATTK